MGVAHWPIRWQRKKSSKVWFVLSFALKCLPPNYLIKPNENILNIIHCIIPLISSFIFFIYLLRMFIFCPLIELEVATSQRTLCMLKIISKNWPYIFRNHFCSPSDLTEFFIRALVLILIYSDSLIGSSGSTQSHKQNPKLTFWESSFLLLFSRKELVFYESFYEERIGRRWLVFPS